MTPERLLSLVAERLIADTSDELAHYEAMLRSEAAPKMADLRLMERLSIERQIVANVEAHGIELALARLRQRPEPKQEPFARHPDSRLAKLVSVLSE